MGSPIQTESSIKEEPPMLNTVDVSHDGSQQEKVWNPEEGA